MDNKPINDATFITKYNECANLHVAEVLFLLEKVIFFDEH